MSSYTSSILTSVGSFALFAALVCLYVKYKLSRQESLVNLGDIVATGTVGLNESKLTIIAMNPVPPGSLFDESTTQGTVTKFSRAGYALATRSEVIQALGNDQTLAEYDIIVMNGSNGFGTLESKFRDRFRQPKRLLAIKKAA